MSCNHGHDYDAGRGDAKFDAPMRLFPPAEPPCPSCGETAQAAYLRGRRDQARGAPKASGLRQALMIGAACVLAVVVIWISLRVPVGSDQPPTVTTPAAAVRAPIAPVAPPPPPAPVLSPAELREQLAGDYLTTVSTANSHLNFIRQRTTKMKGGYALWAVHDFFTQSSFSIGPNAGLVSDWIARNRPDLIRAGIVRVGFQSSNGYLGSCYFDVR